jgi:hypothetical protein
MLKVSGSEEKTLDLIKIAALVVLCGLAGVSTRQAVADPPPALFVDLRHVDRGLVDATFDPARLSAADLEGMKNMEKEWNLFADLSGHGMKRVKLAFGVRFTIEKARKSEAWLRADRPWEQNVGAFLTVLHTGGKYRCWYQSVLTAAAKAELFPPEANAGAADIILGYAESDDGFDWRKPELDVYRFEGKATNLVKHPTRESAIFLDERAPPAERYKCFDLDEIPGTEGKGPFQSNGLYGCISPDGIHWSRLPGPLLPYLHDTHNVAAWDPQLQKYVGYFRGHLDGRAIGRSETDDFRKWPPAEVILCPGPEDSPFDDYYTNCFTTYPDDPSLRLLFPAIFHHDTDEVDVRVAVSRNNRAWNWISRQPIIELGPPGAWDSGTIYAGPNLVHLPDGRLVLPFSGLLKTHNEGYPYELDSTPPQTRIAWATWDDGRLAGLEARERGEFWTQKLGRFEGTQIAINARTRRNGRVEVALHEPRGAKGTLPLPGYGFEDGVPFSGDEIWKPLEWKTKKDLSELRGKELVLHFRLTAAKVFACRFVE